VLSTPLASCSCMDRINVISSAIASVSYNRKAHKLDVQFTSGRLYRYLGVPPHIYGEFLEADSKGRFFEEKIRGNYEYELLS
jgi:hypothetical protein